MKKSIYLFLLLMLISFQINAQEKNIKEDQKYVVVEELTGTWCSYCPRGTVKGRELSHDNDNVIFVAIHTSDPMAYSEYSDASGLSSAPSANINRKHMGADTQSWESMVTQEANIAPPAYISVETNYNESTRELEAIVSAEFIEDFSGNLRLGGLVLEDAVTGQSGYDQSNSYSGGSFMGGFETLPNPVPANMIAYDHLSRYLLGGYDGAEGSIPSSVNSGETHSYTFNYTLSEEYNHEYIRVAAWLINSDNGQVLNAGKSQFLPGYDNAKPHFISEAITTGNVGAQYDYHLYVADPETNDLELSATGLPEWLTLAETAQHSVHTAGLLSGIPTETGVFPITLSVSDGDWTTTQTFDLVVSANTGSGWELIGEEGFTNSTTGTNIIKLSPDDVPYVAVNDYGSAIEVYKFENNSWSTIGSNIGIADSQMDFDIDSEGNPWVAFNDVNTGSKCVVKMFDGNTWISIGNPVSTGGARAIDLAIDNNDIPYVSFYEQDMNTAGFVYKYESDSWQMVGSGQIDPGATLFFELDFLSDNTPTLLWCRAPSNYSFYSRVSMFIDGEWTLIAGGDITENTTYFYHNIAINENDEISVSICENLSSGEEINIYQLDNDNWINIGPTDNLAGEYHDLLVDDQDNLYLGFQNANQGSQTSVIIYDGEDWASLGPIVISGVASHQTMAFNSNYEPYIAFTDNSNGEKTTVKAYLSSELAIININPTTIVFPDTYIGHTAEEIITISNSGNITLVVNDIISDNDIFTVSHNEFTLEPGESQDLSIEFNPLLVQLYTGMITMTSNDATQENIEIEINGNGDLNTGILEQNNDSYYIYPQPAIDFISIVSKDEINTIVIYNFNGQEVLRTNCSSIKKQLNISDLDSGIYMIKIETNIETFFEKLIIQ